MKKTFNVYLSYGANIGNTNSSISLAIKKIAQLPNTKIKNKSPKITSQPQYYTKQPNFTNGALHISTEIEPNKLLHELQKIEKEVGRVRTFKNAPRVIDIDIIFIDDMIITSNNLIVPHPYMHEREFVLLPMSYIAKDFTHPVIKKSVSLLLDELLAKQNCSTCKLIDG